MYQPTLKSTVINDFAHLMGKRPLSSEWFDRSADGHYSGYLRNDYVTEFGCAESAKTRLIPRAK